MLALGVLARCGSWPWSSVCCGDLTPRDDFTQCHSSRVIAGDDEMVRAAFSARSLLRQPQINQFRGRLHTEEYSKDMGILAFLSAFTDHRSRVASTMRD